MEKAVRPSRRPRARSSRTTPAPGTATRRPAPASTWVRGSVNTAPFIARPASTNAAGAMRSGRRRGRHPHPGRGRGGSRGDVDRRAVEPARRTAHVRQRRVLLADVHDQGRPGRLGLPHPRRCRLRRHRHVADRARRHALRRQHVRADGADGRDRLRLLLPRHQAGLLPGPAVCGRQRLVRRPAASAP